jgi:hypothetical protein
MITLKKALAGMALASTLALGGCFDTAGALRQQISPRPVPPVMKGYADADIDRAVDYATGVAMTNGAMRSGSNARLSAVLAVDEAADRRLRHADCQPGIEAMLVATIPADPGYPSTVVVCKDLKSPLVRSILTPTAYTPATSYNDDGTSQALVIDSNLVVTYRWISHRERLNMERLRRANNSDVECPSWYVARQLTVAGSATVKNPYGYKAWSCFWNPNNVYTTSY